MTINFYCRIHYKRFATQTSNIFFIISDRDRMSILLIDSLVSYPHDDDLCSAVTSCTITRTQSPTIVALALLPRFAGDGFGDESVECASHKAMQQFSDGLSLVGRWGKARVPEHDTRNRTPPDIVRPGSRYRQRAADIDPQRRLVSATKASLRPRDGDLTKYSESEREIGKQLVRHVCGYTRCDGPFPLPPSRLP